MIKCWSLVCFLVLAVSYFSRGQDVTTQPPNHYHENEETTAPKLVSPEDGATSSVPTTTNHQSSTSGKETDEQQMSTDDSSSGSGGDTGDFSNSTKGVNGSEASQRTTPTSPPPESQTTGAHDGGKAGLVTTTSSSSTSQSAITDDKGSSTWAVYVTLVLIILVIIVLCVILYLLRRVSRSYSFDLQRPVPTNHLNEPAGTFEQVYVDDLDRLDPKDQVILDDLSPTPVANGTTLQSEEKSSTGGDDAPQEEPDINGVETSPARDTSPTPGDEQADSHSANSINLFFDMAGEEQLNGNNNNNPSVCSSDPFVEINLDDPALCDQLLTSPGASSSVLPFAPFSLPSSS